MNNVTPRKPIGNPILEECVMGNVLHHRSHSHEAWHTYSDAELTDMLITTREKLHAKILEHNWDLTQIFHQVKQIHDAVLPPED